MARVTYVKKAQQRYETKPVIDPATGEQKRTPVMVKDRTTGEMVQKVSKRGPVFLRVTEADKDKPKGNLRCDFAGCEHPDREIKVGQPYKHVTPKSGPYGGQQRNRHADHPSWDIWELSNSWSARIAQATDGFDVSGCESAEDVTSALSEVAEAIRELAEESRETAQNIEDGFGHPTSQSEEAEQRADDLESWADEIENADVPELPEPEERYYVKVEASQETVGEDEGHETEAEAQEALQALLDDEDEEYSEGDLVVIEETPDEPTEEQMDEWHSEVEDAVDIVNQSPV